MRYTEAMPEDLGADAIVSAIRAFGGSWHDVSVHPQISSTNAVGLAGASGGAASGTILVADVQTSGRGRLDRSWDAPAGTSALFSVVVRPYGPHEWGTLTLLAGVAVAEAVQSAAGLKVSLKWPNDLIVRSLDAPSGRGGKIGGLLAERDAASGAIALGVGINVDLAEADLPVPGASSLTLAGVRRPARAHLIGACLARIEHWYEAWDLAGTDPNEMEVLLAAYRERCLSIGAHLRVARPGAEDLVGLGAAIGPRGELVVDVGGEHFPVVVGDVVHATVD